MTKAFPVLSLLATMVCVSVFGGYAKAELRQEANYLNPAAACQVSEPAGGASAKPRATGFRNESATQGMFVICGYGKPTRDGNDANIRYLILGVTSIDGIPATVNCTGVTGLYPGHPVHPLMYSTLSVTTNSYSPLTFFNWFPADWGSADIYIPGGYEPSVTCLLPPRTAIIYVADMYDLDYGM
ncbi:hypothetical protein [Pseudoluteimonas lycopersici]|nr:hypothetical protein [Lysobacter lycopersici]